MMQNPTKILKQLLPLVKLCPARADYMEASLQMIQEVLGACLRCKVMKRIGCIITVVLSLMLALGESTSAIEFSFNSAER